MSDLARQRSARDIWISRSHIYASAAGVVMLVIASFAVGYGMGRSSVDLPAAPTPTFAGEMGEDALVELLGRVDATATPDGGVRQLTFPDTLAGQGGDPPIPVEAAAQGGATLPAGGRPQLVAPDGAPVGRWTVVARSFESITAAESLVATLQDQGVEAWVGTEQVDGGARYRAAIGGWGSRTEAEAAAMELESAIAAFGGRAAVVRY